MMQHRQVEIRRVGEGGAQQCGGLDRIAAIGERNGARFLQQSKLGDLLATEALGDGCRGQHVDLGIGLGAPDDEIDQGAVVDGGLVSGISTKLVTPPAAAASPALASVSRYSCPGSPVNTRMSISPGARTSPPASISVAPLGAPGAAP